MKQTALAADPNMRADLSPVRADEQHLTPDAPAPAGLSTSGRDARRRFLRDVAVVVTCAAGSSLGAAAAEIGIANRRSWVTRAAQGPGVIYRRFESRAAAATVSYHAFLPAAYDLDHEARYPVLYWLHGRGRHLVDILLLAQRIDSAIRRNRLPACIVVFPFGMEESLWIDDTARRVPMETMISRELVAHIDATLRTLAHPAGRAVEGFGSGGAGAARFAMRFPGLFGAASLLGASDLRPDAPASGRPAHTSARWRHDPGRLAAHSPWTLAHDLAPLLQGRIRLRQMIGTADALLPENRAFQRHLVEFGIRYPYVEAADVGHDLAALIDAAGDAFWDFHRTAFAAA